MQIDVNGDGPGQLFPEPAILFQKCSTNEAGAASAILFPFKRLEVAFAEFAEVQKLGPGSSEHKAQGNNFRENRSY
jgi:hypothetical protein